MAEVPLQAGGVTNVGAMFGRFGGSDVADSGAVSIILKMLLGPELVTLNEV